jgi:hypothetical protein
MKNILLGVFLSLVFLPSFSFAAGTTITGTTPGTPCDQLPSPTDFFNQQAEERDAFGKSNPTSVSNHDSYFQEKLAIDMARRTGKSTTGLPVPSGDDPTFTAFEQKQFSDKQAFLANYAKCGPAN